MKGSRGPSHPTGALARNRRGGERGRLGRSGDGSSGSGTNHPPGLPAKLLAQIPTSRTGSLRTERRAMRTKRNQHGALATRPENWRRGNQASRPTNLHRSHRHTTNQRRRAPPQSQGQRTTTACPPGARGPAGPAGPRSSANFPSTCPWGQSTGQGIDRLQRIPDSARRISLRRSPQTDHRPPRQPVTTPGHFLEASASPHVSGLADTSSAAPSDQLAPGTRAPRTCHVTDRWSSRTRTGVPRCGRSGRRWWLRVIAPNRRPGRASSGVVRCCWGFRRRRTGPSS